MLLLKRLPRRVLTFLAATFAAAAVATTLTAAPAQAAWSSAYPVNIQLTSYSSSGGVYQVGRVVGSLWFDSGNSAYQLSLIMCRQSSYTNPNVRISVNGSSHHSFSPSDGTRRPESCGGGHGMSGVISGVYSYSGVVRNLTVTISGIHFDFPNVAKDVVRSSTYDNPFN